MKAFEAAARATPDDPDLLGALSSSLLARAERGNQPEDIVAALSAAERAHELNPAQAEARFDRALALDRLFLEGAAVEAWEAFLEIEPASERARSAAERLATLKRGNGAGWEAERQRLDDAVRARDPRTMRDLVSRFRQPVREHVEELLGEWAESSLRGDEQKARDALAVAEALSPILAGATGDAMMQDCVGAVRRASGRRLRSSRKGALIQGLVTYRKAKSSYDTADFETAAKLFDAAQADLGRGGTPFRGWALFYLAACDYYHASFPAAASRLARLERETLRDNRLVLMGQVRSLQGLMQVVRSNLGESLSLYRSSLDLFEKAGETENAAFQRCLIAENFNLLGDTVEEWRGRYDVLSRLDQVRSPKRRQVILMEAAIASLGHGDPRAALHFQNAGLEIGLRHPNPAGIANAYVWRARILLQLEREEAARSDLEQARAWLARMGDAAIAPRIEAEVLIAEGRAKRASDLEAAIESLSGALAYFIRTGEDLRVAEIHLERGRLHLDRGAVDLAEADFLAGVEAFEKGRGSVGEEQLRISYFDQARDVFDEMIDFQVSRRQRPDLGLAYAERARARELLESVSRRAGTGAARPGFRRPAPAGNRPGGTRAGGQGHDGVIDLASLQGSLPEGSALVYYASLSDRLLSWVVRRDAFRLVEVPVPAAELNGQVADLRDAIARGSRPDETEQRARRLYDELIRPLSADLRRATTLVLVPDKSLNALPFSALVDRATGRYLVQDFALAVAPSATLWALGSEDRSRPARKEETTALLVGNPRFDRAAFPGLSELPGAEAEALRISRLYTNSLALTGDRATKRRFLELAGRYSIVHLAAHALTNDEYPLLSRLVFAPDPRDGSRGTLFAHELYGRTFPRTRLVILAGCGTASGRISRGEGVMSLARPFLSAGVPTIVASLWDVGDAASAELFERFHERLQGGASPVDALRESQLALIQDPRPEIRSPRVWASYELIGAAQTASLREGGIHDEVDD